MAEQTPAVPTDEATRHCRDCADWIWRSDVAMTANGPLSVCIASRDGNYTCPRWRAVEAKHGRPD